MHMLTVDTDLSKYRRGLGTDSNKVWLQPFEEKFLQDTIGPSTKPSTTTEIAKLKHPNN